MRKVVAVVAVLFAVQGNAQVNLVPNPSFEMYDTCPNNGGQIDYSTFWSNPTLFATPDYFNGCGILGYSAPNTYFGYQQALTGNAYAGIITFAFDTINPAACRNKREYVQVGLIDTLDAGVQYCVRFFVRLADSAVYAANNIGVYFGSSVTTLLIDTVLPFVPQINNNALTNPLTSKNSWTMVQDSFIANGTETYMILGNFEEDVVTDTVNMYGPSWFRYAYYLIENIEVVPCDSLNSIEYNESMAELNLFPNPAQQILNIEWSWHELTVIRLSDCYGKEVRNLQVATGDQSTILDVQNLPQGLYFLEIQHNNILIVKKIVIQ